jgi:hypothetical protein
MCACWIGKPLVVGFNTCDVCSDTTDVRGDAADVRGDTCDIRGDTCRATRRDVNSRSGGGSRDAAGSGYRSVTATDTGVAVAVAAIEVVSRFSASNSLECRRAA